MDLLEQMKLREKLNAAAANKKIELATAAVTRLAAADKKTIKAKLDHDLAVVRDMPLY